MEVKKDICPHCGGTNTVDGKQTGQACVTSKQAWTLVRSQPLFHVICLDCGTVIRSYIEYPKQLS